MNTWILIADAGRARLLEMDPVRHSLTLLRELEHPASRLHDSEVFSDRAGRIRKNFAGGSLIAMNSGCTPKEMEAQQFAHQLAAMLEEGHLAGSFGFLAIAAPPHFLGLLRPVLSPQVRKCLAISLAKDLTSISLHELPAHLADIVPNKINKGLISRL